MAADLPNSPPPSFAALAKRISAWTSKGLLSAMILVAGLGFGLQVLRWWATDKATPEGGRATVGLLPTDALGDPSQPHQIDFGDGGSWMRRQTIRGDKQKAIERLRAACRGALSSIKPRPVVAPNEPVSPKPGTTTGRGLMDTASDEKFLKFLSGSKPVDESPGRWRLYEFNEAVPMAVGLVRADAPPPERGKMPRLLDGQANLAQLGYRAIIWGLAMPMGEDAWSLCVFQPENHPADGVAGSADIPLPPECRRMLSLRADRGGGITAFSGPDRPDEWRRFYDQWAAQQGWRPVGAWQAIGAAWYAKFAPPGSGGGTLEIRFGPDGRGGSSGVLIFGPRESL